MQKNAKSVSELHISHKGILDGDYFNEYFALRCYRPSEPLEPFVVHIWTQRHKKTPPTSYRPLEVCSGPNAYLFLTEKGAFIHGTVAKEFPYDALMPGVIAGVKFKPGGFYPFYKRPVIRLADRTEPAVHAFPELTSEFTKTLLGKKDEDIVEALEKILIDHSPQHYSGLDLINRIMSKISEEKAPHTVASVAKSVGRSERAIQLLFHHHVGVSLKWAINRQRLLKTIDKAMMSGLSWTNASAEEGYSNQSHFTREFKQATGLSPSMYLKSLQKNLKYPYTRNEK